MKNSDIIPGKSYAYASYMSKRWTPHCHRVTVLALLGGGKVEVIRTRENGDERPDSQPFITNTRNIYATWEEWEVEKAETARQAEVRRVAAVEANSYYEVRKAELLRTLAMYGVDKDPYYVRKATWSERGSQPEGEATIALTLADLLTIIVNAREAAVVFGD